MRIESQFISEGMLFFAASPYSAFLPLIQENEASLQPCLSSMNTDSLRIRQSTRPIDDIFIDPSPFRRRDPYASTLKAGGRQSGNTIHLFDDEELATRFVSS